MPSIHKRDRRLSFPFELIVLKCLPWLLAVAACSAYAETPATQPITPLPVKVAMSDPAIRYVGRFDRSDPAAPRCAWTDSEVIVRFNGTAVNVLLKDTGSDEYEIVIDGKPASVITAAKGQERYAAASGLADGEHTVELWKRTEPNCGTTTFIGFELEDGKHLLPLPPRPTRRIEIIGDSITCGYGDEGKSEKEHFSPATENGYLAYGAIAARPVNAEYTCIAWSGRKMWPNNTMGEVYDRTLPKQANSSWDFSQWIPDAVVITLATNDFGKANPDEAGWTKGYEDFLDRLRKVYPKAVIYCASSPMMSDSYPKGNKAKTTLLSYLNKIIADRTSAGDTQIHLLEFQTQNQMKDGLGSDWHPSLKTQEKMAKVLEDALEHDLGWTAAPGN